jgi:D-alanyl-lipoteichoic acid acyltransferase DltB (MBOAT superfamily)
MPFNSFEFLFGFLPATLLCVYIATRFASRRSVVTILIVASFLFYAWSSVLYLMMFAALTGINNGCGRAIGVSQRMRIRRALLTVGCAINLGVVVYFKYRVFAVDIVNETFDVVETLVLPLGISFFIFQKIAFLVDVYRARIREIDFQDYVLFVTFFPQLIAGPIVHYGEMQPQFDRAPWAALSAADIVKGISLITIVAI